MELLKFMMELDIYNYLIFGFMVEFMINYLIDEKINYRYSISHNFEEIRIDSHIALPMEKILTFHNKIATTFIHF